MTPTEFLNTENKELKKELEKHLLRSKVARVMLDYAKKESDTPRQRIETDLVQELKHWEMCQKLQSTNREELRAIIRKMENKEVSVVHLGSGQENRESALSATLKITNRSISMGDIHVPKKS